MKRFRSSDDLDSSEEKVVVKDWVRREDSGLQRSSSSLYRNSYYKPSASGRKVLSSSTFRYDRLEDDRGSSRFVRKRSEYDVDSYNRRKSYNWQRDVNERGFFSSSPRESYGMDRTYRPESISGPRRDFPKGFRSNRDGSRRESSFTSPQRFGENRMKLEDVGKSKSKSKSPSWSKDSESENSKSNEVKQCEDMHIGGKSSEREEGELEPDPHLHMPLTEPVDEDKAAIKPNVSQEELDVKSHDDKDSQETENFVSDGNCETSVIGQEEPKAVQDALNENKDSSQEALVHEASRFGDENETTGETEGEKNVPEGKIAAFDERMPSLQEHEVGEDMSNDHVVKVEDIEISSSLEKCEMVMPPKSEMTRILKDKGKSVALLPLHSDSFAETNTVAEEKQSNLVTSEYIEMKGPITRDFQFFFSDSTKKLDKAVVQLQSIDNKFQDDKLALDLSLSLPNVLLPIGSQNREQAPGSPSHTRSIQSFPSSFQTCCDGLTASMSFSGSQQFTHNPSCSLTLNGYDFEQSVGSKPLFQGVDWKALSSDENKNKEFLAYQGITSRGNGFRERSQVSLGESSKRLSGLERQINSFGNGQRQVIMEKCSGSYKRINRDGKEQILVTGDDFSESIITMIVSEPIHTMAPRFNEMTEKQITRVKDFVHEIVTNPSKQWQLVALQKALHKRTDLTLDALVTAHNPQLEIMVALKTGLQEFILKSELPLSDLAEIYLNMRCRNLTCRSLLHVDECDCKICAQRNGFCRECMCLVCLKFDNASNTCSWVGCDVCLHWCHADCGLRESHIRNGCNVKCQGDLEVQFHCLACDHPSEMFGFVKEVFQNFVKVWRAVNLSRELEYVRRIFCASEDVRGKRLHEIASLMLSKLGNGGDLQDVRSQIVSFFTESDSLKPSNLPTKPQIGLPTKNQERSKGFAGWIKSAYPDKATPLEASVNTFLAFDSITNDKYTTNMDLGMNSKKEAVFDEVKSIVRVKQAEAKMFQSRANDARKEAEALKRISITKNKKIEEEYSSRIMKLRLIEADEMRKQKVEELKDVERAHQEFFNMKMRMERDIKDLLLKMEATRRNFTA